MRPAFIGGGGGIALEISSKPIAGPESGFFNDLATRLEIVGDKPAVGSRLDETLEVDHSFLGDLPDETPASFDALQAELRRRVLWALAVGAGLGFVLGVIVMRIL